jgi:formate dehydrogenase maturation protein FdhE
VLPSLYFPLDITRIEEQYVITVAASHGRGEEMEAVNRIKPEAAAQYVAQGGVVCPFCGSKHISGGDITIDNGTASQEVDCTVCEETWHDIYTLTSVTTEYAD